MPRLLGMITARRPGSFPFAKAMCSEGARCLLRGTAAVASMPQDFEQFPTTDGDIEEPSCGRPGPRAAVAASITGLDPKPFPMSITVAIAATHVSLYIVRRSPAGPCRLEKTLSPAISSDRRRTAPMRIAAGPAIGARCPLDHDRQRALFSIYFSKAFQVTATDCSTGLRIFFLCDAVLPRCDGQESTELFSLCPGGMRQASPDVCAVDEQPLRRCCATINSSR